MKATGNIIHFEFYIASQFGIETGLKDKMFAITERRRSSTCIANSS